MGRKRNKTMKKQLLFTLTVLLSLQIGVKAQQIVISEDVSDMPLQTENGNAYILVDDADAQVVATVAQCLRQDVAMVTGKTDSLQISNSVLSDNPYAVIVGTLGQSDIIDVLKAEGKIDVSAVEGKWEVYAMQVVDNPCEGVKKALVVFGSTPRGTAYGMFEISRLIGVHPWYWWADITPETRPQLYVSGTMTVSKEPSVKYRGIFINDEDWGIHPWAKATLDKANGSIGPRTYEKVFELILRMKANLLWPAMHECLAEKTFWYYNECREQLRKWDVVMGSSHCDVMLRCNNSDWLKWYGYTKDSYNYATNAAKVQAYWAERAGESKDIDAIYTIGMRGVHDSGLTGYSSTTDKVNGLTSIFKFQRQLIADSIASYKGTTVDKIPQTFIPYKEVLDAYNAGLQVPEDVILCWVDDNHGYIRQLSNATEQKRPGGGGIYYHLSYYGSPHDYLWLSSTSPSLISYELCKAYDMNTRDMWIINVGDIKPAEAEIQFCMDLAWDIDSWRPEEAYKYIEKWAVDIFGETLGKEIAAIKTEYYRLAANGKPEHIAYVSYSESEMNKRIEEYNALVSRVTEIKSSVPQRLKFAFFQLVQYPVQGAAYMNTKIFRATQSLTHAAAGYSDALKLAKEAETAFNRIKTITSQYNTTGANNADINNPKWKNFMSYCPRVNGNTHFNMPTVATSADVASTVDSLREAPSAVVAANDYISVSGNLKVIEGLGTSGKSLGVLPVTMKSYSVSSAPSATYSVPVFKGRNSITLRLLPTFPINSSYDLRVAYSVDGGNAVTKSFKTTATSSEWSLNVVQGYAAVVIDYESKEDGDIALTVYFLDPSVVLSDVKVTGTLSSDDDGEIGELLEGWILNADFDADGNSKISKKVPTNWTFTGSVNGSAISVTAKGDNSEIAGNQPHWQLWTGAGEMSQTVKGLPAGKYTVVATIVATGVTSSYLFANNSKTSITSLAGDYKVSTQIGEEGVLKLGINKTESGSDIEVDNFRLYYLDPAVSIKQLGEAKKNTTGNTVYNINGQKVEPSYKGIVVENGRKILNR